MSTSSIVVINPNSSDSITHEIRDAVGAGDVDVVTSMDGPAAIESDADVIAAVEPLVQTAAAHPAEAYVVACFSDPGLDRLRAATDRSVFGIAESAMGEALERGHTVGVISSVAASVPRHARYWAQLGVLERVVGDLPLNRGVLDLNDEAAYLAARDAGRQLVELGADVIVLGCAGMTHMEVRLEAELGVAVVDPCRAAVARARRALAGEHV